MRSFRMFLIIAAITVLLIPMRISGQAQTTVKIMLTPYEGNPILTPDKALAWEVGTVARSHLISYKGLLYMFYHGYAQGDTAGDVGYATSQDGLHWTKYKGNPVFVPDKAIAPNGVMNYAVILNGETWIMYFTPWPSGKQWYEVTESILMATAASPNGPWKVAAEPVLAAGRATDWDAGGYWPTTVMHAKDGYVMFYESAPSPMKVGMATSPDGIRWTKYNDPATTSALYAASDPVFEPSQDPKAWDRGYVAAPTVRLTDKGWEMFYGGGVDLQSIRSIGYATSPDGIKWTRLGDAPLLTDPSHIFSPEAVVEVNGKHYLYYEMLSNKWESEGLGVATITYE